MKEVQAMLDKVMAAVQKLKEEKAKLPELKAALEKAVAELEAEEAAYKKKCDDLQAKIDNPSTSGMQKAKANNELAQLKSEDPLPLRRAKITQEAALRKVQKQGLIFVYLCCFSCFQFNLYFWFFNSISFLCLVNLIV